MGSSDVDGGSGYDRSDEDDDFVSWSDRRREAKSAPPHEEKPTKAPPKTLTERLADAATDRKGEGDSDTDPDSD